MSLCEAAPPVGESESEETRGSASRTLLRLVGFVASALDVRFAFVVAFDPPSEPRRLSLWLARDYGLRSDFAQLETPEGVESAGLPLGRVLHRALPHEPELADTRPTHCFTLPLLDARGQLAGHLGVLDAEGSCRFATRERLGPLTRRAAVEVERWVGMSSR